jgi:hypothetical protein
MGNWLFKVTSKREKSEQEVAVIEGYGDKMRRDDYRRGETTILK